MFAIVRDGSMQFRAEKGATIRLAYRKDAEPGATLTLDQVLLLGDGGEFTVGTPTVKGATVTARVAGMTKGPKLIVYRYRRRKNSDKKRGHREKFTDVVVETISAGSK